MCYVSVLHFNDANTLLHTYVVIHTGPPVFGLWSPVRRGCSPLFLDLVGLFASFALWLEVMVVLASPARGTRDTSGSVSVVSGSSQLQPAAAGE